MRSGDVCANSIDAKMYTFFHTAVGKRRQLDHCMKWKVDIRQFICYNHKHIKNKHVLIIWTVKPISIELIKFQFFCHCTHARDSEFSRPNWPSRPKFWPRSLSLAPSKCVQKLRKNNLFDKLVIWNNQESLWLISTIHLFVCVQIFVIYQLFYVLISTLINWPWPWSKFFVWTKSKWPNENCEIKLCHTK